MKPPLTRSGPMRAGQVTMRLAGSAVLGVALVAALAVVSVLAPAGAWAEDDVFERDLSNPFLRDRGEDGLRRWDLPGPLRKAWPYRDRPEHPFPAVEARRACHARALHELRLEGVEKVSATQRLQSQPQGDSRYLVAGAYRGDMPGGGRRRFQVSCLVSSKAVVRFGMTSAALLPSPPLPETPASEG